MRAHTGTCVASNLCLPDMKAGSYYRAPYSIPALMALGNDGVAFVSFVSHTLGNGVCVRRKAIIVQIFHGCFKKNTVVTMKVLLGHLRHFDVGEHRGR